MCSVCGNSFWRVGDHLLPSRHFFYACSGAVMSFAQLALAPRLLENLQALGYQQPTPIQQAAIPPMLAGQDLMASAQTGTGKTAAFVLPILHRLLTDPLPNPSPVRALVLVPTRELALQVHQSVEKYAGDGTVAALVYGGVSIAAQVAALQAGPAIVIATPGRLLDHLRQGAVSLAQLEVLVFDEADRMLDMGFMDEINALLAQLPAQRQTLLFSATYPDEIARISAQVQKDPVEVSVEATHDSRHIDQSFFEVERGARASALLKILAHFQPDSCVVFCNTKRECQSVHDTLRARDISVLALHGDLEQRERDQVLVRFANRSCRVLVATDVAARGLDIKDLAAVINYEMAQDPEIHIHRIGRTGRAGQSGLALSLCTPQEMQRALALEDYLGERLSWINLGSLKSNSQEPLQPEMVTLCIDGGKKAKIRPGDILGALTGEAGLAGADVGKIDLFDTHAYVAVRHSSANKALKRLQQGKLKGKSCKVRLIG